MLMVGTTLATIAIEVFLVENNIIDGGIIGISLLLNHITDINFGVLVSFINIPFLIFGYKYIGRNFCFSSLFSILFSKRIPLSVEEIVMLFYIFIFLYLYIWIVE